MRYPKIHIISAKPNEKVLVLTPHGEVVVAVGLWDTNVSPLQPSEGKTCPPTPRRLH